MRNVSLGCLWRYRLGSLVSRSEARACRFIDSLRSWRDKRGSAVLFWRRSRENFRKLREGWVYKLLRVAALLSLSHQIGFYVQVVQPFTHLYER